MLTNSLIAIGSFLCGLFVGAYVITLLVAYANKQYEIQTGNNFLDWLRYSNNNIENINYQDECEKLSKECDICR